MILERLLVDPGPGGDRLDGDIDAADSDCTSL